MATVRLSNSAIAEIKSHMKNTHFDKARDRWYTAVADWRQLATPSIDELRRYAADRSIAAKRSWETVSTFAYISGINGKPLTYITPDEPQYRALHNNAYYFTDHAPKMLAIQADEIKGEVGNFDGRWFGSSEYQISSVSDLNCPLFDNQRQVTDLRVAGFGRTWECDGATFTVEPTRNKSGSRDCVFKGMEAWNLIGETVPVDHTDAFKDPMTRTIPMPVAVPMLLPLPARLSDAKLEDFKTGDIFPDMQSYIAELGTVTRGKPEFTLTGAIIPRQGSIRYFVSLEDIPIASEVRIREGLREAADMLTPSIIFPDAEQALGDLIKLVDMYKSVNALVRDVPTMFPLLPPYIQTKLREETPKRSRSNPDAPDKDKLEELKRKAMAHHLS